MEDFEGREPVSPPNPSPPATLHHPSSRRIRSDSMCEIPSFSRWTLLIKCVPPLLDEAPHAEPFTLADTPLFTDRRFVGFFFSWRPAAVAAALSEHLVGTFGNV